MDILFMLIGSFGALLHGISLPCMIIVFGDMLDSFLSVGGLCDLCDDPQFKMVVTYYNNISNTDWNCEKMFDQSEAGRQATE